MGAPEEGSRLRWILLVAVLLPFASASPTRDAESDVHVSPQRGTVEHAAREIDLLSFDVLTMDDGHHFLIEVQAPLDQTLPDSEPAFAVTFANDEIEYGAIQIDRMAGEWHFHLWSRNGSLENVRILSGSVGGNLIEVVVPMDALKSDLAWFVVSSSVKADREAGAVDGGPVWLRDSLPDEGRGPPRPLYAMGSEDAARGAAPATRPQGVALPETGPRSVDAFAPAALAGWMATVALVRRRVLPP